MHGCGTNLLTLPSYDDGQIPTLQHVGQTVVSPEQNSLVRSDSTSFHDHHEKKNYADDEASQPKEIEATEVP